MLVKLENYFVTYPDNDKRRVYFTKKTEKLRINHLLEINLVFFAKILIKTKSRVNYQGY